MMARTAIGLLWLVGLGGCDQAMDEQPRFETYEPAPQWPENSSARQPVAGTVARGEPLEKRPDSLPVPLTRELLETGQRRYNTFCSPCHGSVGDGDGMIVRRGFPAPPSFHTPRLRQAPLSHYYDVISEGYGVMYSYAARVTPADRWAVAAYVRALQLSQHAEPADLPADVRNRLETGTGGGPP